MAKDVLAEFRKWDLAMKAGIMPTRPDQRGEKTDAQVAKPAK